MKADSFERPWKSDKLQRAAVVVGPHRYRLTRRWLPGQLLWWLMLNPSKANDTRDDPTADKCCKYAHALGYSGIGVVNLFALISTDPKRLDDPTVDPVGPDNDAHLLGVGLHVAKQGEPLVLGWGTSLPRKSNRAAYVVGMLRALSVRTMALRVTKDGAPWHPLYLPDALRPEPYDFAAYRR